MTKIRRGNVILRIDDANNLQRYLNKGYQLIDQVTEEAIKPEIPTNVGDLTALVNEQKAQIEELQKKLAELSTEEKKEKRGRKPKNN